MSVDTPTKAIREQQPVWELLRVLAGGTQEIRKHPEYLPQQERESAKDYKIRLSRACLYPAVMMTVNSLTGRAFDNAPAFEGVPEWVAKEVEPDIDRARSSMALFLPRFFQDGVLNGWSAVLVESPKFADQVTVQEATDGRIHPYLLLKHAHEFLEVKRDSAGTDILRVRVKFTEEVEDPDTFESTTVNVIRVYRKGEDGVSVQRYVEKKNNEGKLVYVPEPVVKLPVSRIPIVFFYANFTDHGIGVPPCREIAFMNVLHYQLMSSYVTICDVAMIPIIALIGADKTTELVIGSRSAVRISNPQGKIEFAEHTGAAMKTGKELIADLKHDMREAGAKLLLPDEGTGNKTATQATDDSRKENSPFSLMVARFEESCQNLYAMIGEWRGESVEVKVTMRANLKPDFMPADTMSTIVNLHDRNLISALTVYEEARRRNVVGGTRTWAEEEVLIGEDGDGYLIASVKAKATVADKNPAQNSA